MNEYLFDVNLFATIRIKAESEAEAIRKAAKWLGEGPKTATLIFRTAK